MFARIACIVTLAIAALSAMVALQTARSAPAYRVIVHPQNSVTSLDRSFVADAFLKKTTRWPSGEPIRPVDLGAQAAARSSFTNDVLRRSVAAVKSYWQQQIFSGRDIPPPELESGTAVREYVLKHRGAVGYVAGDVDVGAAKIVAVR